MKRQRIIYSPYSKNAWDVYREYSYQKGTKYIYLGKSSQETTHVTYVDLPGQTQSH